MKVLKMNDKVLSRGREGGERRFSGNIQLGRSCRRKEKKLIEGIKTGLSVFQLRFDIDSCLDNYSVKFLLLSLSLSKNKFLSSLASPSSFLHCSVIKINSINFVREYLEIGYGIASEWKKENVSGKLYPVEGEGKRKKEKAYISLRDKWMLSLLAKRFLEDSIKLSKGFQSVFPAAHVAKNRVE